MKNKPNVDLVKANENIDVINEISENNNLHIINRYKFRYKKIKKSLIIVLITLAIIFIIIYSTYLIKEYKETKNLKFQNNTILIEMENKYKAVNSNGFKKYYQKSI